MVERIREIARELGIEMIGFACAEPFLNIQELLINRAEGGVSAEFEEPILSKHIDPSLSLEGCKGIISVAIQYDTGVKPKSDCSLRGSLSKSSWGTDYHKVLGGLLRDLAEMLQSETGEVFQPYVDTGPLVDREVAHRAGIGYYGKNCSIINPEYGSWIFLGYILTTLKLESVKTRLESQCGECRLCLDACPTGALEAPGVLNSKKCISYLTQTKGMIELELQTKMGVKIYGCDTCQLVCPKNKGIPFSAHHEFIPEKTGGYVDILEVLSMSKNEFAVKYGSMAGSWRGRSVLIRNALIALENTGLKGEYLEELENLKERNVELYRPYLGCEKNNH